MSKYGATPPPFQRRDPYRPVARGECMVDVYLPFYVQGPRS
jgi:hypothetical protein